MRRGEAGLGRLRIGRGRGIEEDSRSHLMSRGVTERRDAILYWPVDMRLGSDRR